MRVKNKEIIRKIRNYISDYKAIEGIEPRGVDIARAVDMNPSTVSRYLSYIHECDRHRERMAENDIIMVPVVAHFGSGVPDFDKAEYYVAMSRNQLGAGDYFIMTANGYSMEDIGIGDGDLVVIRKQNNALPGEVIAVFPSEYGVTMLKRYYPSPYNQRIRLKAENQEMLDLIVTDCKILGVAVKTIKNL